MFFSWQSDARAAACRTLIGDALELTVGRIATTGKLGVEAAIDRDTLDVPGTPDILAAIFEKIDSASAFVADVTIVGGEAADGKGLPNPNVMVELGYAIKTLGWSRILLIQNTAFGGIKLLPFDLPRRLVTMYESHADAIERAEARKELASRLEPKLRKILAEPKVTPLSAQLKGKARLLRTILIRFRDLALRSELAGNYTTAPYVFEPVQAELIGPLTSDLAPLIGHVEQLVEDLNGAQRLAHTYNIAMSHAQAIAEKLNAFGAPSFAPQDVSRSPNRSLLNPDRLNLIMRNAGLASPLEAFLSVPLEGLPPQPSFPMFSSETSGRSSSTFESLERSCPTA